MSDLSNMNVIKAILGRHGFKFSHALGQNFIIDPDVCPSMADNAGIDEDVCVLEIGPGIGVLTKELCKRAKKVVAVEIDTRLLPVLDETLKEFDNVKIINGDIMKLDVKKLFEEEFGDSKAVVCANLPYYITSPIIMYLLESGVPAKAITVMVQKEAAVRLCAKPGERECGAVSAAVHYRSKPEILFDVPRECFMPSPNVDSAVIRFDVLDEKPFELLSEELFFKVVSCAFTQRRKTAVNSISAYLKMSKAEITDVLISLGISEKVRAENITLEEFTKISNELYKRGIK